MPAVVAPDGCKAADARAERIKIVLGAAVVRVPPDVDEAARVLLAARAAL